MNNLEFILGGIAIGLSMGLTATTDPLLTGARCALMFMGVVLVVASHPSWDDNQIPAHQEGE